MVFDDGVEVAERGSSLGELVEDVAPAGAGEALGRSVKTKLMNCTVGAELLELGVLELGVICGTQMRSESCYDGTANHSLITVLARFQSERQGSISYTLSCLHRQHHLDTLLGSLLRRENLPKRNS